MKRYVIYLNIYFIPFKQRRAKVGTVLRTILELLRIVIIIVIFGALGGVVLGNLYTINDHTEQYSWLGVIAILLLVFVLYRNKLQFSGWYKGKGRVRLPRMVSYILVLSAIILIILPFVLGSY